MEILVITGLSGGGKSKAASFLEDVGFYIVDNLPSGLILKFAEFCAGVSGRYDRVALVYDVRAGEPFSCLLEVLETLKTTGCKISMLFLEASPEAIIKRYKETRRIHPLMKDGITEHVAVAVIDQFEVIQINDDQRSLSGGIRVQILFRIFSACVLVQQLGERIPFRFAFQQLRISLFLVNVGDQTYCFVGPIPIIIAGSDPETAPQVMPVCCCKANLRHAIIHTALEIQHHTAERADILRMEVRGGIQLGEKMFRQRFIAKNFCPVTEIAHGVCGHLPLENHILSLGKDSLMPFQRFQQMFLLGHGAGNVQKRTVKLLTAVIQREEISLVDHPAQTAVLVEQAVFQLKGGAGVELFAEGVAHTHSVIGVNQKIQAFFEAGGELLLGISQCIK